MLAGTERLRQRVEQVEAKLAGTGRAAALAGLIGHGTDVRAEWEELDTDRKRAVIEALTTGVKINPRGRGSRSLKAGDIEVLTRERRLAVVGP